MSNLGELMPLASQLGAVTWYDLTRNAALMMSESGRPSISTRPASIRMPIRCCPDMTFCTSSGAEVLTEATSNVGSCWAETVAAAIAATATTRPQPMSMALSLNEPQQLSSADQRTSA